MTLTGRLERMDLGAGGYRLVTDDGEVLELVGEVPAALAGKAVRVRGERVAAMGFLMSGSPTFEVHAIESR